MKKSWKRILAVAAILALALCVLSGCSDNTQTKIDEAVNSAKEALIKEKDEALAAAQTAADEALKSAQEAADAAKAELEGQVADLTGKLTAAEETAKTGRGAGCRADRCGRSAEERPGSCRNCQGRAGRPGQGPDGQACRF